MRLLGVLEIAFEEDDAGRTEACSSMTRRRGDIVGAVKAHDEQLADLAAKFEATFGSHKE